MQQVLFYIPILQRFFGPDGLPIHGFGAMLFVTFVVCMSFAVSRGRRAGIAGERIQDLCLVLLVSGILGARVFYMVQYQRPFGEFFHIWEGGIVFYGSIIGGIIGYIAFYYYTLRPLKISTWVLVDIVAPALAMGLMLGRIGCLLNGCCYGQVACADCPSLEFPLLTGPVRSTVVKDLSYQTSVGFSASDLADGADPRTVVRQVEPGSQAKAAGLQPGDKILKVNGIENGLALLLSGNADGLNRVRADMARFGPIEELEKAGDKTFGTVVVNVLSPGMFILARDEAGKIAGVRLLATGDWFNHELRNWPKGHAKLTLIVERNQQELELPPFTPRSIGLQPTQIYESISMGLMVLLLLSFFPFRRHDGQVMVLLMLGYSVHRFLNEMLRNDTDPVIESGAVKLSASMTISIIVFLGAIVLEVYLRNTQERKKASGAA